MSRKNVATFQRSCQSEKSGFYKNKKVTRIDDIDVNKILVSKEEPYCMDTMIMMLLDCYA